MASMFSGVSGVSFSVSGSTATVGGTMMGGTPMGGTTVGGAGMGGASPLWLMQPPASASESEAEIDKMMRLSRERARAAAKRAAEQRKIRDEIAHERRLQERAEAKRRQKAYDVKRRVFAMEGRVKQLTAKALATEDNGKIRSELSYVRAQLFWTKNGSEI